MKNRPGRPPSPGICHLSLVICHWSFFNEKNSSGSHAAPCDREPRMSLLTGGWYGTSYGVHEGVFEEREGLRIADCGLPIADFRDGKHFQSGVRNPGSKSHSSAIENRLIDSHPQSAIRNPQIR